MTFTRLYYKTFKLKSAEGGEGGLVFKTPGGKNPWTPQVSSNHIFKASLLFHKSSKF